MPEQQLEEVREERLAGDKSRRIPVASTTLVGREVELVTLAGRVLDPSARLVTLTGPGGVGKSRLAAAVAYRVGGRFRSGVGFVDVATCDLAEVCGQVRRILAVGGQDRTGEGPAQHWLGDEMLLVLDGCERAIEKVAGEVAELLDTCPGLRVLVTSREPLRVYGERLVPVAPLATPNLGPDPDVTELQEVPSVILFVERARAVSPGFALTHENAEAIAEISVRLDGLPLAIELAAGRLRLFQVHALLARLRRGDDVLVGGPVNAPVSHRSFAAVLARSYDRLDEHQRTLLNRIAVFDGGFVLGAAQHISDLPPGATEAIVEALIDKNLVTVSEQLDGEPRFAVPETNRGVCLGRLIEAGELAVTRDRHAAYYRELVAEAEPHLTGRDQPHWLQLLELEHRNLEAALEHLRERGDGAAHAGLAVGVHRFWLVRGHLRSGLRWLDEAADYAAGSVVARATEAAGAFADVLGDLDGAIARYRRAVAAYRERRDGGGTARTSIRLGLAMHRKGDRAGGRSLLLHSMATLDELGDRAGVVAAQLALAAVHQDEGQPRPAEALLESTARTCRQSGDARGLAAALFGQAELAMAAEDASRAELLYRESLQHWGSLGERTELAAGLEAFGLVLRVSPGQHQRAVRLLAVADSLRRATQTCPSDERRRELVVVLGELRGQLGSPTFALAWREGCRLSPTTAVVDALSAPLTGHCARQRTADTEMSTLTARQQEVALLVAKGMTNRQIARRLGISEWTVVNHVRQVMRRLDCASRIHVARLVHGASLGAAG